MVRHSGKIGKWGVTTCAILFTANALAAVADLVIESGPLLVTETTTYDNKTIRYEGHNHAIRDNLTLKNTTYLRLKGGSKTVSDTLSFGPTDNAAANQHPVVTIQENSGFYATYRNGSDAFLDDPADKSVVQSYLTVNVGENGGSGLFLVQSVGGSFSSNIKPDGLWLWQLTVSENATSDGDYIDILQLDSGGVADIDSIVVNSDKPARIIFNDGTFRDNQQTRGDVNPFQPAKDKELVLEGIGGNDIKYDKSFCTHALNGGAGVLRIQGDCNFVYTEGGDRWGNNRLRLKFGESGCGPIIWDITGDFILGKNSWAQCNSDDALPTNIVIRMRSNAVLDPNGNIQHLRSLISESASAMVTNAYKASSSESTLVFGADGRDCVFSACCTANINVEKIGEGTLVISNATVEGAVTIKEGRVRFVGDNNLPNLIVEEGAEVLVGCVESSDSIKRLDIEPRLSGKVSYEYDSDGEMLLRAGDELGGMRLDVKRGAIRFTGDCSDKFWRYTITSGMNSGNGKLGNVNIELSAMWLWPSNYMTVSSQSADYRKTQTYGTTTNSVEEQAAITSPSQLAEGRCMAEPAGLVWQYNMGDGGRDYNGPDVLFNNSFSVLWNVQKNSDGTASKPSLGNPDTWYSVVFRLKESAPAVAGYSIARTHWSPSVGAWILSSSPTGEEGTWTVRDEHTVQWANTTGMYSDDADRISEYPHCDDTDPDGKSQKVSEKWYNNKGIYRFTQGASDAESFTNVRVSVASGAKLDTTYINDSVLSFSELNIDGEGGTITKFAPAINGRINLSNVALSATPKTVMTVSQVIDPENLDTWKVYVDGVEDSEARIKIVDGELRVGLRKGMIFYLW